MAARAIKQLVVKTGEYVDNVTGKTKGRWQRVGTMFKHDDNSVSLKFEAVPIIDGGWNGWVSVFDMPDQQQQQQQQQQQPAAQQTPAYAAQQHAAPQQPPGGYVGQAQSYDDEIPF